MRRLLALAVAAIAVSMLAMACGGGDTQTAAEPGATSQSASTTAGASFDQTFIDAMVPHHQQAIEMAQAAKDAGLNQAELVEIAFEMVGRRIEWRGKGVDEKGIDTMTGAELVAIDSRYFRPTEVDLLLGDATKARDRLGWRHTISFREMVAEMVREDLKLIARDQDRKDIHG